MPIYEYKCEICGQEFEKLVLNNSSGVACPKCQSSQIKRQFSVFAARSGGKAIGASRGGRCSSCSSKSCSTCG